MGKSIVVKNASALEPFSRDKLLMSIYDSLKHRKTAVTDAAGLTDTVVGRLYNTIKQAQVGTADIIAITSAVLKRFDKAAATHYLAFHPIQASDS